MKISTIRILAGALVLASLVGCAAATDNAGGSAPVAASPRVLTLNWTGTSGTWSNVSFGFYPLTGKTVKDAKVTWAYNAGVNVNSDLNGQWRYKNTGDSADTASTGLSWTSPSTDFPSAAATWTTASSLTDLVPTATDNVALKLWQDGGGSCIIYVKQVVLAYSDNTNETLTFESDGSSPVQAVYNGTTTTTTLAKRVWTYNDNTTMTLTTGFISAPF
jgi:hypothetical protein